MTDSTGIPIEIMAVAIGIVAIVLLIVATNGLTFRRRGGVR